MTVDGDCANIVVFHPILYRKRDMSTKEARLASKTGSECSPTRKVVEDCGLIKKKKAQRKD